MKTAKDIINRTCLSKISMSKEQADSMIDHYAQKNQLMFYYKCMFCNRYHASKKSETVNSLQIIGGEICHN